MICQVGEKHCSNSGRKWIDINPLESDLVVQSPSTLEFHGPLTPPPHPPGISNSLRSGGLDIFWNHAIVTCKSEKIVCDLSISD